MIISIRELIQELNKQVDKYKCENSFVTVALNNEEYVIGSIRHVATCSDTNSTHLCLNIRDGGEGVIKR